MATAQVAPPPGFVLDEPTIPSPPEGFVLDSQVSPSPSPVPQTVTATTAPAVSFSPGRENPELGLYDLRVPRVDLPKEFQIAPQQPELPQIPEPLPQPPVGPPELERALAKQERQFKEGLEPMFELPKYRTEEARAMFLGKEPPASLEVGGGLYNALAGAAESLTSPASAVTLGVAGAGQGMARLASGIWAAFMGSQVPSQVNEARKALKEGRPLSQQTEAVLAPIITTALATTAGRHALAPAPVLSPVEVARAQEQSRLAGLPSQDPIAARLAPETTKVLAEPTPELKPGNVLPEAPKAPETPQGVSEPVPTPQNAPTGQPSPIAAKPKKLSVDDMISQVGENGLDAALSYFGQDAGIDVALRGGRIIVPAADRARATGIFSGKKGGATQPFLEWLASDKALAEHIDEATAADIKKLRTALGVEAPTAPEPAISFPGLGSLREADATPMRLGQIRKAEPELWKAMTQHFGVDAPAKIAKLAKERFEQMRNAPPDKPPTKWASATEEPPLGTALYGPFGIPSPAATAKAVIDLAKAAAPKVKDAYEAAKEIGQEALNAEKMTDYRRSVLNWSAKLQRSFGESAAAQKEIRSKVPDEVRREGITNWIQAGGDTNLLAQRAAATTDPKLKAGYEAAMNLTPEELAVASDVKAAYDALGVRGQTYSVLSNFRDNYVTQIWDLKKGPATGSSRTLKDKFRYSKARAFDTFFDGEQAGYTPKTKDIAKLLPVYMHEMNSVIAARQLVEQMSKGVASDGRPLVAPRGVGVQVGGPMGQATLIIPKVPKGNRLDYKMLENQPALSEWVWRTEDSAGNPVFEKADLALHPEAHARLKKVLGRSAIREWYETRTSAGAQIPKVIVKGLDIAQSETKRTMLGFFAPFHQVQEGTHAIGHRINPFFNIPKVDLVGNARQMDAARHGLMLLPDRVSESQFMEGFQTSGLVSRIPGIGPMADWYSNYLFKQYIPGLKFKTYEAILERNTKVYEKDLASGAIKPEDVKALSAEQANAAYGHLNYADLARGPTIQHIAQIGLLAPDFLEARGRFAWQAAKGAVGTKVGREQVIALATLALAQAATAWIAAKTTGGEWDSRHPFEFTKGSRRYTMRSVPEDIDALVSHSRTFWNSRLSPIIGKGALQYASEVDYAQRKVSPAQTTKELLTAPIPLNIRSIPALQKLTGMDRPGQVNPLEQLAGTMGLKISRNYPRQKLDDLHAKFLKDHPDPKVRADYERHQTETVPVSKYKAVYSALSDRNGEALQKAVDALEAEGEKLKNIKRRLNPRTTEGRRKSLFHERRELEREFRDGLDAEQYKMYEAAMDEREAQWDFFRQYY